MLHRYPCPDRNLLLMIQVRVSEDECDNRELILLVDSTRCWWNDLCLDDRQR